MNGLGKSKYQPINPIWLDDPETPGLKIPLGPLLNIGQEICDELEKERAAHK